MGLKDMFTKEVEVYDRHGGGLTKRVPRYGRVAAAALAGAMTLTTATCSINTVPAGHVGVRSLFGDVREQEFYSGFNFKNPFESVEDMSIRTTETKERLSVPTSEGLIATLDVSVLYKIAPQQASDVYKTLGPDGQYEQTFISPNLRSAVRDVVANYKPEALYSKQRENIATDISQTLTSMYAERGVILEQVLIRDLQLPPTLVGSIEAKMQADQKAQTMTYVLQTEEQEAQRKRIEAQGIADAQAIISESLDQPYLQWKYIESLQGLVESDTNTVIVMPYDSKLTPMLNVPTGK